MRKVLTNLPAKTAARLFRITEEKEQSQTRKRQRRSSIEYEPITFEALSSKKSSLNQFQVEAIIEIANAQGFRKEKMQKVIEICDPDREVDKLSQTLKSSQLTDDSDETFVEPEDEEEQILTRPEWKECCLKLCTENNLPPSSVNLVVEELLQKADLALQPFHETTLRRNIPLMEPLLLQQETQLIRDAPAIMIGQDSTTMSGIEFLSFTIRSTNGDALIFDVKKTDDHAGRTVADIFEKKIGKFSQEDRHLLAVKTQLIQSDSAPAAVDASRQMIEILNGIYQRPRVFCPCSMHVILNSEKSLRKLIPSDFLQQVNIMEKLLSTHRLHQTKNSAGNEFLQFLQVKEAAGVKVYSKSLGLYSNVRFNTFHENLRNILMNFNVIPEFLRRKKLTDTADYIEKHRGTMEVQFLASILVYQNLVQPWWSKIRAMSDTEYYQILKAKMVDSIENIMKSASPAVAICNPAQNLMIDAYNEEELFQDAARAIKTKSSKELDNAVRNSLLCIKDVYRRFAIKDDVSSLIGQNMWTNQLAEFSMGALKYVHERRSNLDAENIAIVARATFNRPITFFREHDPQVLVDAFKYGNLRPLHEERKRAKLSKNAQNFEKEQELQRLDEQQRLKDASLLASVSDYIPQSLSEV